MAEAETNPDDLEAAVDAVMAMSDDEIRDAVRAEGKDPDAEAERLRQSMLATVSEAGRCPYYPREAETKEAHTPGPWFAYEYEARSGCWSIEGSDVVADLWRLGEEDHHRYPHEEIRAEANARLIAAAPCLLAALKYAVNSIEAMRPTFAQVKDEGHAFHDQVLEAARAAIQRAEA